MFLQGKALLTGVKYQHTLWLYTLLMRERTSNPSSRQMMCHGQCCALPYATELTSKM